MKMTVELPDALIEEARAIAERKGLTLRELIEEGLRKAVEKNGRAAPFKLRDLSYGSGAMNPEFEGAPWETIRDAIYGTDEAP